jgi:hypothetical protein
MTSGVGASAISSPVSTARAQRSRASNGFTSTSAPHFPEALLLSDIRSLTRIWVESWRGHDHLAFCLRGHCGKADKRGNRQPVVNVNFRVMLDSFFMLSAHHAGSYEFRFARFVRASSNPLAQLGKPRFG